MILLKLGNINKCTQSEDPSSNRGYYKETKKVIIEVMFVYNASTYSSIRIYDDNLAMLILNATRNRFLIINYCRSS